MSESSLPYHEPDIVTILILTSLLLLLNLVGYALDKLIYCGLLGQLFIGVAWGTPGGQWLSVATQEVFVQLGYLGLILLVYEGGLSTNFNALKSNLFLSVFVALTGIAAPISISFVLMGLVGATPLQSFAAGAALCSTSLGTTFTVLKTSGLTRSRLGVVLTSSAMLDDVVGLVMVQIISNLGANESSFSAITVVRPIGVSLTFAVVVPLVCQLFFKPLARGLRSAGVVPQHVVSTSHVAVLLHTTILVGFVVASSYAGASNLFAAYLAGASISWYDSENVLAPPQSSMPKDSTTTGDVMSFKANNRKVGDSGNQMDVSPSQDTDVVKVVPKPSTPAGGQTLPFPANSESGDPVKGKVESRVGDEPKDSQGAADAPTLATTATLEADIESTGGCTGLSTWENHYQTPASTVLTPLFFASIGFSIPISQMFTRPVLWRGFVYAVMMALAKFLCGIWLVRFSNSPTHASASNFQAKGRRLLKPKSLYPASILGCAMVARGEIGFLISAVAESRGIFSSTGADGSSELFLIVTWAIMLCTIAGPIAVGLLTRRVRRLQELESERAEGREDPLGIWGVM